MKFAVASSLVLAAAIAKVSADCFSTSQGFPCCSSWNTKVEYTDASGKWGLENGNWCGMGNNQNQNQNQNKCVPFDGYQCCPNGAVAQYSDSDAVWGVNGNNWCIVSTLRNTNNNNNGCNKNGYRCCSSCSVPVSMRDNDGSWGIENGDWCYLNNCGNQQPQKTTTKQNPQPTTPANTGGVPLNPPKVQNRAEGKTTRYWDCCLASCSWKENVKKAKNSINTCKKDGTTLITDVKNLWKYKSGCEGGQAYMCNNQQPWAVNENVAFGFVASGGGNGHCCQCEKLEFTSGPVAGKQMIVQVSNIGYDLASNQFDIQMPGGGFGIFDGCTSQFGVPSSNWGERYGGVKSESQCSGLPAPLQAGCKWRFNWFKNADNPKVVHERVQCPKELTDISGCIPDDDAQQKKPW